MKMITHTLTSTTPTEGPAMTLSGLASAVTFLTLMPTALILRLLTLLNLNAVVLYYPFTLPSHENIPLTSFDNNTALKLELKDQTADLLPLWLSRMLQNHNLSQSMPEWKGQIAPVAISIQLIVNFTQPPAGHLPDQMATILNISEPIIKNGIPQVISSSDTASHLHNKPGPGDHEDHEPRTEMPFRFALVTNLLVHAVGWMPICFALWRRTLHSRPSYRSFLRMTRKVAASPRGHVEHVRDQKDTQVSSYEDILSKGTCFGTSRQCLDLTYSTESSTHEHPHTHVESSIREWTSEDDYETEVTGLTEPGAITLILQDFVAGFEGARSLRILPGPSSYSENSLPCCRLISCPPSPTKDSELGTSGTLDLYSASGDRHVLLAVLQSRNFTNTEDSQVQRPPDHSFPTSQENSLIHSQRQLTSEEDSSTVTCRELVLHSRYPRAWEIDDLVAAWRCFVRSRGGKRWLTYGIIGIAVLLETVLENF